MDILATIWCNFYFQCMFKIILIIFLSGIIGMERDNLNKPAGFRTHTLLGISAVLVVICGEALAQKYSTDPFRIAAQFLSGIGFIGAGTILRDGFNVKGLTTASGLLAVSCIGLCVGAGFYFGAIIATIFTYFILSYSYVFTGKLDHFDILELEVCVNGNTSGFMKELESFAEDNYLELKKIEDINRENKEFKYLRIVCKYNVKMLNKNKIITKMASLRYLNDVNEVLD